MIDTCCTSSFSFECDCRISGFKTITEWSDFTFYVFNFLLHETKTAGLNEAEIHSLTALMNQSLYSVSLVTALLLCLGSTGAVIKISIDRLVTTVLKGSQTFKHHCIHLSVIKNH